MYWQTCNIISAQQRTRRSRRNRRSRRSSRRSRKSRSGSRSRSRWSRRRRRYIGRPAIDRSYLNPEKEEEQEQ